MTGPDYRGWAGHAHGWRYLAEKIDGSGTSQGWLDNELPLQGVQLTETLSGPPQLTGTISPVQLRELGLDTSPRLGEWSTLVHAEKDGSIYGSYFLVGSKLNGPKWDMDCPGMSYYPKGQPYPGDRTYSQVDPLDIVRDIWLDLQARQDSNIRMFIDNFTRTDVQVGAMPVPPQVTSTASQSEGTPVTTNQDDKPFEINWWSTHDCGAVIDQLAQATPFDYRERHTWNTDHTAVEHFLDFGYPSIGIRRSNLRFMYGSNIQVIPEVARDGSEWANHVIVLGAGDGSAMIRGEAVVRDGRVRRTVVVEDKWITDTTVATTAARLELARRNQLVQMDSVVVRNNPAFAEFGSFQVGDEIQVVAKLDWTSIDNWYRVISMTTVPEKPDMMALGLLRADWMTL